ncbi:MULTISPECIES: 2-oxoacid:ferredoxin oxidoreductase subunit beta [Aminobacterium]|jgi:2-oxoglutarate ferredoxin oxidoreductase subunit beta|uniref:Thiamine pyrophosphate protein domain protein TPP-binding protein n=1 Tax=Aminobacterium colombiense (strain DSM 12261 / ALA-1) TaxID=572547 RepID=D5EEE7_AMICL|nr:MULTISPECIES: 2-oxoacid:ferredoxin oxidoreductase subunit beta [Aminobacterium]MDD2379445.1 2-oxoacid:ferredoxin oxidoreductase subunit beta [Aminobacterium colombiense]ADE56929.1 thiamine pyrophosphate protein domain protein TPP-binding protein [Aminobacterium colombiense DSM 12261]MDD3767532.1 2-oxoacid:ferredoxin oxidoreductase subunit beta [Aminobacterium colombiense]MDD4266116.1 2-oxoacid:ferredoxin oxidoreductase subunit beta [Aminobacterium colombiense]MDD4586311.1 2-oxoacid:ferredox
MPSQDVMSWLRTRFFPHIWCPGCGHGIIMHALLRALVELDKKKSQTVIASGIGCSSRMPGYIDACTVHTTHGRSLAFATGIKLANPSLTVVDVMGDGDCSAIGGNHFIHACRRNIDITAIVMNNNIYGMTGGQASPTTPQGALATTTPYGAIDPAFDICRLAEGAGASYVARATIANPKMAEQYIANGIKKKGFAVIEIVSSCHTQFGRRNKRRTPIDNINYFKENTVTLARSKNMSSEELAGKIVVGEFVNKDIPEYTEQYLSLIERVRGKDHE